MNAGDAGGADRVMAGSDWPIVDDGRSVGSLAEAMHQAGLSEGEQRAVAAATAIGCCGCLEGANDRNQHQQTSAT